MLSRTSPVSGGLSRVEPQVGPAITYSRNSLGYVESVTRPGDTGDRVTTMDQNSLGWIRTITYPDGLYETFSRDSMGYVTNAVDRTGRITSYTYLPTHKPSSVTRNLGTTNVTTSIAYDNQFNTLHITDALGRPVETYELDIQDRPVSIANLEGQTMTIGYGIGNFVNSVTRFDGTVVSNRYNSDGGVSSVAYPGSDIRFSYLRNGLMTLASNSTCAISSTWSAANRLTQVVSGFQISGLNLQPSVSYSCFPAGQVSDVTSVAGTTTYED